MLFPEFIYVDRTKKCENTASLTVLCDNYFNFLLFEKNAIQKTVYLQNTATADTIIKINKHDRSQTKIGQKP